MVVDYRKGQSCAMTFEIEIDREVDGRWIAEVPDLAGVQTYTVPLEKRPWRTFKRWLFA